MKAIESVANNGRTESQLSGKDKNLSFLSWKIKLFKTWQVIAQIEAHDVYIQNIYDLVRKKTFDLEVHCRQWY